jgi:hypothetical protein
MFGFRKKRPEMTPSQKAAYDLGRNAGDSLYTAVNNFLKKRLAEVSTNLLGVLADRFGTIYSVPDHAPETVAKVEYKIFLEQLQEFESRLTEETMLHCNNG